MATSAKAWIALASVVLFAASLAFISEAGFDSRLLEVIWTATSVLGGILITAATVFVGLLEPVRRAHIIRIRRGSGLDAEAEQKLSEALHSSASEIRHNCLVSVAVLGAMLLVTGVGYAFSRESSSTLPPGVQPTSHINAGHEIVRDLNATAIRTIDRVLIFFMYLGMFVVLLSVWDTVQAVFVLSQFNS